MTAEKVLWEAEFNPKVKAYWLLSGAVVLAVTVIGIPLVPIWLLAGLIVTGRYLATYRCTLTNRNLKVNKGLFVKQEKTVPLDRITDLGLVQGPVMRLFGIEALSVETAGQSSQGSLIQLTGIRDGRQFRDAVLAQRDQVVGSEEDRAASRLVEPASNERSHEVELLSEIRDTLARIESRINAE